jgi:hypothetical protein
MHETAFNESKLALLAVGVRNQEDGGDAPTQLL